MQQNVGAHLHLESVLDVPPSGGGAAVHVGWSPEGFRRSAGQAGATVSVESTGRLLFSMKYWPNARRVHGFCLEKEHQIWVVPVRHVPAGYITLALHSQTADRSPRTSTTKTDEANRYGNAF